MCSRAWSRSVNWCLLRSLNSFVCYHYHVGQLCSHSHRIDCADCNIFSGAHNVWCIVESQYCSDWIEIGEYPKSFHLHSLTIGVQHLVECQTLANGLGSFVHLIPNVIDLCLPFLWIIFLTLWFGVVWISIFSAFGILKCPQTHCSCIRWICRSMDYWISCILGSYILVPDRGFLVNNDLSDLTRWTQRGILKQSLMVLKVENVGEQPHWISLDETTHLHSAGNDLEAQCLRRWCWRHRQWSQFPVLWSD